MPVCSPGVVTAPLTKAVVPSVSQSTGLSLQEPLPAGRRWKGSFYSRGGALPLSLSLQIFFKGSPSVYILVHVHECVCIRMCTHTWRSEEDISGSTAVHLLALKQGLSMDLRLTDASQCSRHRHVKPCSTVFLFCFLRGAGDSNSVSSLCLPRKSLPPSQP